MQAKINSNKIEHIVTNCKQRSNLTQIENIAKILNKRKRKKESTNTIEHIAKIVNKNQLTQLNALTQNQR